MNVLLLLGTAHVLGDFLLQTDRLAAEKTKHARKLLLHGLIYALVMGLVFLCGFSWRTGLAWAILGGSHLGIDALRVRIDRRLRKPGACLASFCVDQALHLAGIAAVWLLLLRGHTAGLLAAGSAWLRPVLIYAALSCVIWKPAAVFIRLFFNCFFPEGEESEEKTPPTNSVPGSGELIGKLERLIIAALVICGQFGAIGFVLTAKSVARFKQIETDRGFAERYLVGTLLSAGTALIAALIATQLPGAALPVFPG
ncbi:MAG: DUF3307 domain-containing protein [Oscillospiraceae bacterium]|nr:DUF3307 domain-containing protein [Oscillospiraceae bacterium]